MNSSTFHSMIVLSIFLKYMCVTIIMKRRMFNVKFYYEKENRKGRFLNRLVTSLLE